MKAGTITPVRGRFWARAPRNEHGKRPSLGVYDTRKEAEDVLAQYLYRITNGAQLVRRGDSGRIGVTRCR